MSRVVMEYTEYSCGIDEGEPDGFGICCCRIGENDSYSRCKHLQQMRAIKSANYKLFSAYETEPGDLPYPDWVFTAGGRVYICSYLEVDGRVLHKEDE